MALASANVIRCVVFIICLLILTASAEKTNKDEGLKCVRWKWTGDVFGRKVYCVEWNKKDCSKRLYKEICKQE